ncbi:MAG: HU family DNA-binding protein [Prevotellaceae bacterium]|jgi:nucleoid DNA-binding protein|nr:HU family DNA-binding protein [Prevotellaceae bacterium]
MNNKELLSQLAKRTSTSPTKALQFVQALTNEVQSQILANNQVTFLNKGVFELQEEESRIVADHSSQKRVLMPPRVSILFKPSLSLKSTLQNLSDHENKNN